MATVEMVAVSKSYGHDILLNRVDLNVERGEFLAVVGPSGSGKSTLLRLVAGLDTVSSGRILINNQCVNHVPAAKRDMAMVFQNYALYPHMTVFANMAYSLKIKRLPKQEIQAKVEAVADLLQLRDYLHRKPAALSGGQRQRVAMGRAMVRSPAVFLFDEPLSNLDTQLRAEMRHEIKKLHQQFNTTSLYVTHDQVEAMTLADRVLVLNRGRVEQVGSPSTLYQFPASMFVAGFIGHYPMNFLPGKMDHAAKKIRLDAGVELPWPERIEVPFQGERIYVGVRPEHWQVAEADAQAIIMRIQCVDNLGADKLVQGIHEASHLTLTVRVSSSLELLEDTLMGLALPLRHANLFCKTTGQRIGDWNDT